MWEGGYGMQTLVISQLIKCIFRGLYIKYSWFLDEEDFLQTLMGNKRWGKELGMGQCGLF